MPAELDTKAAEPTERLAEIRVRSPLSIIIPTYKEAENIPPLLDRLERLRAEHEIEFEVLLMDDDSRDGSVEAVRDCGYDWARIIVRTEDRGLSQAVVDGLNAARHPVVVVMDADLSHPPEKIPDLILALESGQEFAIGSRYVPGGSTDDEWGFFRWLNSRVATLLARPLTDAHDPMAGFFAFRRADLARAKYLNPVGYKIGLEIIVKCGLENVGEVPIRFTDRVRGQSKLTFREQLKYLKHLRRLYIYKFRYLSSFGQFAAVGLLGMVVNLAILSALVGVGVPEASAVAVAIAVSMVSNFLLNRRFTFGYARGGRVSTQFLGFVGACSIGALINYAVTLGVHSARPSWPVQVAAVIGIGAGTIFNYLTNQFLVFRDATRPPAGEAGGPAPRP